MTAAAGYELAGLQSDLGDLGKWVQGAAGSFENTKTPQQSDINFLNTNFYVAATFNEGGLRR